MKTAILILSTLLLLSNGFWVYHVVDTGVTLSYKDQTLFELEQTRNQLAATLQEVAKDEKKEDIIRAAGKFTDQEIFDKGGCTWVGWLGFKFDENNRLKSVSSTRSNGEDESNPCLPAE
jgi:hypothetical protein